LDLIADSVFAAVVWHQAAGETVALSPAESFTAAITMEGLLFAAFSVGTKLTETTVEGRSPFFTQAQFGWCIVIVIGLVAAAAGASWWEIFGSRCPATFGDLLLETGLALGIVTQPIFAAVINVESKKTN
jgi:hypothetical protein